MNGFRQLPKLIKQTCEWISKSVATKSYEFNVNTERASEYPQQ